jgi:signal transduction histidine kinase
MSARPKILLVDDKDENLVALQGLMADLEAELLMARSGREALELLLVHDVALALIDVQMPEMDGYELAELMRGAERTRSIPIMFVTAALRDQGRVFKGYEAGAVDFLMKPLDPHALRSKVEVFLELYRKRQQLAERVRELEAAEARLLEADRRKDEFLAVLSHELRNPLMPIETSTYLLRHAEPGSDRWRRAIDVIERQARHMAHLVEDLLDVSRITSGKVQLHVARLDLTEIVRRSLQDHRQTFDDAGVELTLQAPAEPLPVDGDAVRLAQIAGNLLTNASKFTPRGGHVRVALERAGDEAVLRVIDDGAGMTADLLARIFEPFSQGDRTLDRSRGGLGLGLSLVRSLARMHGGEAKARSDGAGRGAELIVALPLALGPPAPGPSRGRLVNDARRRRVLIVEDNVDGAAMLREVVELLGHEVAHAHDGTTALMLARAFAPDLVLCDIGLPGIDGYELARRLKADEHLRGARVVALTGYASPADRQRAAEAGFDEHVPKPPAVETLKRLLAAPAAGAPSPHVATEAGIGK